MNQANSTLFGKNRQHHAGNPLPFSAGTCLPADESRETLSDVGEWPLNAAQSGPDTLSQVNSRPEADGEERPQPKRLSVGEDVPHAAETDPKCYHSEEVFQVAADEAPETCNTGGSIRHGGITELVSGGLDTLEVSLYGCWPHPQGWEQLTRELNAAKTRAESGLDDSAYIVSAEGDHLTVEPVGAKKGVHCRWVLNWNGCRIAIVNNRAPSENRLSVHVSIGSIRLMEEDHEAVWQSVLRVLSSLGYMHDREVVGRVDLCIDLADRSMGEIESAINQRRLIVRARKAKRYEENDQLQTYVRGSGPLLVRIYDKAREVRNDPVKHAILVERRWGKNCQRAIRVEFQLRNKALKRFFLVRTMRDLFDNLGTIAKWCTSEWFRIVEPFDRANRNHSRAVVSELWESVQEAFESWTGTALPRTPKPRRLLPELKQLKQQAVGCVSSIVAHVADGRDFMTVAMEIVSDHLKEAEDAVKLKRQQLEASCRVFHQPDPSIPF